MRRRVTAAAAVLLAFLLLASCGSATEFGNGERLLSDMERSKDFTLTYNYSDGAQEPPTCYPDYTAGVTAFALRQLRVRRESEPGSFVFCPSSAVLQTALLANAGSADTRAEILSALGGKLTLDEVNACSSYFKSRMESVSRAGQQEDTEERVCFDGALLVDADTDVKTSFLQTDKDYYGYDVLRYAFADEHAADKLATYLKPYTADSGFVPSKTIDLLSSCTVTDGWLEPSSELSKGSFLGQNGSVAADFFCSAGKLLHSKTATGILKYTAKNPLKLLVAVPNKGVDLDSYVQGFDSTELNALLDSMDVTKSAAVSLPVFSVSTGKKAVSLADVLTKSGLFTLFSDKAGFSGLSFTKNIKMGDMAEIPPDFTLDRGGVNHQTDPSPTAVSVGDAFTADRPFVFFLLDNESNIPVLSGVYR